MDTLYTLCRSADNLYAPPFTDAQAEEIAMRKRAYFANEAARNPLVREILQGGTLSYFHLEKDDHRGFLVGPATFFRTHEILRHTRQRNAPINVGSSEHTHNEVADWFAGCIPNTKFRYLPRFSPARYTVSLGFAWGLTLLIAHLVAREDPDAGVFDVFVAYHLGIVSTIAALAYTALKSNRDVRRASPWNSALYLDLNADLVRRNALGLAAARKEVLPRQKPFKHADFYYALSRRIEAHGFDDKLTKR